MEKRLFTFGCSFTQYRWPTWANLISDQFDKFYNYGLSGFGNLGIACSVAEADARHKFTSDDTVIVMWTNCVREDRWISGDWYRKGHIIYMQDDERYAPDFVEKCVDVKGCYIRDFAQIHLTKKFLETAGCKFEFLSMVEFKQPYAYETENINDVIFEYRETLDFIKPSIHKTIFNHDWTQPWTQGEQVDYHPLPRDYAKYINTVLPEYELSQEKLAEAQEQSLYVMQVKADPELCDQRFGLMKLPLEGQRF